MNRNGTAWQSFAGHVTSPLSVLAFVLPLLAVLGGRQIFLLFIAIALWGLFRWRKQFSPLSSLLREPLLIIPVLTLSWAVIGLPWAVWPEAVVSTLQRVGSLLLAGCLLLVAVKRASVPPEELRLMQNALFAGMGAAFLCVVTIILFDGGFSALLNHRFSTGEAFELHRLKQGNLILAMLVWPLHIALLMRGKARAAVASLAVALLLLVLLPSRTALVCFVVSVALYSMLRLPFTALSRLRVTVLALTLMWGSVFILPFVTLPPLPAGNSPSYSFHHRLHIWQYTAEKIGERPLLGWGIKSTDALPGNKGVTRSLHPHHNLLQAWLDIGLPGVLAYLALVTLALRGIYRSGLADARLSSNAYAALTCALIGGMSGFGLWQSWWVTGNVMVAVLLIALLRGAQKS